MRCGFEMCIPLPGGVVHGPRGPTSYYYMLPMKVRVMGLKVALSSKLAQVRSLKHSYTMLPSVYSTVRFLV